jgi:DNA invertase Pin-like site-specific DNA recombinase
MNENTKITADHLRRCAVVYVRQSTAAQVEHNRESTERQYNLVERAVKPGWKHHDVNIIDQDLGISGSGFADRSGFASMTSRVALGEVGIVFGLEVSRLARNNADWYRLLDLCGITNTLIGDADGNYHPAVFNDRLVHGLKGTMSEAEVHVIRARLHGGIRNKAARGELRRGLPVGFVWGDEAGEIRFHPDEAVIRSIRTVFDRFAEMGSVRQVWLSLRSQDIHFPLPSPVSAEILGVAPTTVHRWLNAGFIAGEQITSGAPWRIRITDELRSRFVEESPEGYLPISEATRILGVSRQAVLHRVKRGELQAVHVRRGRRKGPSLLPVASVISLARPSSSGPR